LIGYRNWLAVICLNNALNYIYAYLEPSTTEDEAPQTAPHPIIFFYLSIFLYLLLLYIILWTLLYCVTNQLFLPLSITKNISSIVSLSYHLHIFLFICKYAILFDYAIIQQIGMEEYLLILNIEYYLLNLDIKNFIYLIFYLFILI
jgi:hypothetical protein